MLRMSNIGKPMRQLWFDLKNDKEEETSVSRYLPIKFLYGHLLEEVLLFLVRLSKHKVEDEQKEVKVSSRLNESPSRLIADENEMGSNMERIMKSLGQDVPETKPILEINPKHPLVKKLKTKVDKDLVKVLFDQAVLSEGGQIKEPAEFVKRMNKLMLG